MIAYGGTSIHDSLFHPRDLGFARLSIERAAIPMIEGSPEGAGPKWESSLEIFSPSTVTRSLRYQDGVRTHRPPVASFSVSSTTTTTRPAYPAPRATGGSWFHGGRSVQIPLPGGPALALLKRRVGTVKHA